MTMQDIIDEVRLALTGHVLNLEIEDNQIEAIVKKAMREVERFWDETSLITVPFASCIDMTGFKSSSVVHVYRAIGGGADANANVTSDPLYMQQWMIFSSGGTMYNLNDYVLNYAAWSTLNQIRNTTSTELDFQEDKHNNRLYISKGNTTASRITIMYIPKIEAPEDIKSDYWTDILVRLSTALTKIVLGRIRTRFSQSNALWAQDGDKMLEEGTTEYKELTEILRTNANVIMLED